MLKILKSHKLVQASGQFPINRVRTVPSEEVQKANGMFPWVNLAIDSQGRLADFNVKIFLSNVNIEMRLHALR